MKWWRCRRREELVGDPVAAYAREQQAVKARQQAEQINHAADRMQHQARPLASKSLAVSANVKREIQENQWTRKLRESWARP